MQVFLMILIVIVCVFLALIVLIQNPKGGGLDSSFQSANQIGGVKRTADFLEKSTWTLAIVLFILCLTTAAFQGDGIQTESTVPFQEQPFEQPGQPSDAGEGSGTEELP
jgi:preprotein translocase subunit SecG